MKTKHQTKTKIKTTETAMAETIVSGWQQRRKLLHEEVGADLAGLSVRAGRVVKRPKRTSRPREQSKRLGRVSQELGPRWMFTR